MYTKRSQVENNCIFLFICILQLAKRNDTKQVIYMQIIQDRRELRTHCDRDDDDDDDDDDAIGLLYSDDYFVSMCHTCVSGIFGIAISFFKYSEFESKNLIGEIAK